MVYTKKEKLRIIKEYLDGTYVYPPNISRQERENIRKRIIKLVGAYQACEPSTKLSR